MFREILIPSSKVLEFAFHLCSKRTAVRIKRRDFRLILSKFIIFYLEFHLNYRVSVKF